MYYDLDDISADFERLECTVNFDAEGLGFLTDSQSGPVFKGTVTELPLWLTEPLATTTLTGSTQEFMMTIKRPKFLGNSVINWLKSDATVLDLHRIMPQFYKLAERWLGLFEDRELADVVREVSFSFYFYTHVMSISNNFIGFESSSCYYL